MERSANSQIIFGDGVEYDMEVAAGDRRLNLLLRPFKRSHTDGTKTTGFDISCEAQDQDPIEAEVDIVHQDLTVADNTPWFADYGQFARRRELRSTASDRELNEVEQTELSKLDRLIHHEKLAVLGGISIGLLAVTARVVMNEHRKRK